MIYTLIALLVPFVILFTFDLELFLVTSIFLYTLVLLLKLYKKQDVVLDVILLITYFLLFVIQTFFNINSFVPYSGVVIYFVLVCFFTYKFLYEVLGFSHFVSKEKHIESLLGNAVLILLNILSIIFSFKLFPNVLYIIVPVILSVGGAVISIFAVGPLYDLFSFCLFSIKYPKEKREITKKIFGNYHGWFRFKDNIITKEVVTQRDYALFYAIVEKGFLPIYNNSDKVVNYEELLVRIRKESEIFSFNSYCFICFDALCNPLGCMRGTEGTIRKGLPFYDSIPVRVKSEYLHKTVELGRFSILANGLLRGIVLQELSSMLFIKMIWKNKYYVLTSAVEYNEPMYLKLGFRQISNVFFDKELELGTILCGEKVSLFVETFSKTISYKEIENNYKRKIIEFFLRKSLKQTGAVSLENILENVK